MRIIIYCDEATFKSGGHQPDDYACISSRIMRSTTCAANNYICHFSACLPDSCWMSTELFRTKFDGSQDHDMILRLTDKAKQYHPCAEASVLLALPCRQRCPGISRQSPTRWKRPRGAVADHLQQTRHSQTLQLRALARLRRFLRSAMRSIGRAEDFHHYSEQGSCGRSAPLYQLHRRKIDL